MTTGLKETTESVEKVGLRTRIIIMSVLLPGLLLTTEIIATCYARTGETLTLDTIKQVIELTKNANGVLLVPFTVLYLAASFALGFVGREVIFTVSNIMLRHHHADAEECCCILNRVARVYGRDKVERVVAEHVIFTLLDRPPGRALAPIDLFQASSSTREKLKSPEFYIRNYCKLWLRARVPTLCMDHIEGEINVFLGFVLPTLLFPLPLIPLLWLQFSWLDVLVIVLFVSCAVIMLVKTNRMRRFETEEVLVNFFFAHWEGLTATEETGRAPKAPKDLSTGSALPVGLALATLLALVRTRRHGRRPKSLPQPGE